MEKLLERKINDSYKSLNGKYLRQFELVSNNPLQEIVISWA